MSTIGIITVTISLIVTGLGLISQVRENMTEKLKNLSRTINKKFKFFQ